jgi:hypothetical protein
MRHLWVGLAASLAVLSAPAGAQQSASPSDRVNALVGRWTCASAHKSTSLERDVRNPDGSITYSIAYTNDGRLPYGLPVKGEFDGVMRFDAQRGVWHWTSTSPQNVTFIQDGTGAPWTSDTWVVEGTEKATLAYEGTAEAAYFVRRRFRMIEKFVSDTIFTREFDFFRNGSWERDRLSACSRLPDTPAST